MILLNAAESRELDRLSQEKYGIPSYSLMTRAGEAVADALVERFPEAVGGRAGGCGQGQQRRRRIRRRAPAVNPGRLHGASGLARRARGFEGRRGARACRLSRGRWQGRSR